MSGVTKVGICGLAGAGKSYVAHALKARIEAVSQVPVFVVGFAEMLRQEVEDVLSVSPSLLRDKPLKPEVRALLQWWGTDLRRTQDPDYWVTRWLDYLMRLPAGSIAVADDVRFLNETVGFLIAVTTPLEVCIERAPEVDRRHPSEQAFSALREVADFEIDSYGPAEVFDREISGLANVILRERFLRPG